MRIVAFALLLLVSALAHGEAALRVMGFGGASNWPIFVAQERGFFRDAGVVVAFERAPDSATQMRRLVDGSIEIALTAMDNVVARECCDVIALLGVNGAARLRLFGARGAAAPGELRGRDIAVDAVDTGYALVLRWMLAEAGLGAADYRLVSVGASRDRWHALRDGRVAAALLNSPYDAAAEREGFTLLARSDALGAYQGSVAAARREWAAGNRESVVAFIRAYLAALRWLHAREHRAEAVAILIRAQPGLAAAQAERAYANIGESLTADASIDPAGVERVLELRRRFGAGRELPAPGSCYDLAYWRAAISTRAPVR